MYKTVYSLIRAEANRTDKTYKKQKDWYNNYLTTGDVAQNNHYINTKYEDTKPLKRKIREKCFCFQAVAGYPVKVNLQNTKGSSFKGIIYLLLHETAHNYYKLKGKGLHEYLADMFAIRWTKKFIEGEII